MKIEKISENKIKITLASDDLEKWDLKLEDLSYNTPKAQEMFWSVVKNAESETEFFTEDSQLIIEASVNSKEGFVILITKIDEENALVPLHQKLSTHFTNSYPYEEDEEYEILPYNLYEFESLQNVCELSKIIHSNFNGQSTLKKYKNNYYLYVYFDEKNEHEELYIDTIISEFGNIIENPLLYDGLISEYGKIILENNAVSILKDFVH
jgi:adapter protein MecA 1/2